MDHILLNNPRGSFLLLLDHQAHLPVMGLEYPLVLAVAPKQLDHPCRMEALDHQGKMEALDQQGKMEALDQQGKMEALDHQGIMEALYHQGIMEALDQQGKMEALDHQGIMEALDHQGKTDTLDPQGKMDMEALDHLVKMEALDHLDIMEALDHQAIMEALNPQGIMGAMAHQGKIWDLDHPGKMEALEHQGIMEDQVVTLDSVMQELGLMELMLATMGQDPLDQDLIRMEDLTFREGFMVEIMQMGDLGHLEDQTNMALKEEVATKVGKVMVDISMGWSSLDRNVPSLHSVIYGFCID